MTNRRQNSLLMCISFSLAYWQPLLTLTRSPSQVMGSCSHWWSPRGNNMTCRILDYFVDCFYRKGLLQSSSYFVYGLEGFLTNPSSYLARISTERLQHGRVIFAAQACASRQNGHPLTERSAGFVSGGQKTEPMNTHADSETPVKTPRYTPCAKGYNKSSNISEVFWKCSSFAVSCY